MELAKNLLRLSLGDLESAMVLYEQQQFRNSYFCFQQSAEKANKAFGLFTGVITEDELLKIGHKPSKIYKKGLAGQQNKLDEFESALDRLPHLKNHQFVRNMDLDKFKKYLKSGLVQIDSLQGLDLVNIPTPDLNSYLRDLRQLETVKITIPKKDSLNFKSEMLVLADWIGTMGTTEALAGKGEFETMLNDESKFSEFTSILENHILPAYFDILFIQITFGTCAIITLQHSTLTRYPDEKGDPDDIYVKTLPLVKKQPQFMTFLEKALVKFKLYLSTEPF